MTTTVKKGRMQKLRNRLMGGSGSGARSPPSNNEHLYLDVPKQTRSASFDEIQSGMKLLVVPDNNKPRSKSFDSTASSNTEDGTSLLDVPKMRLRRRSSGDKNLSTCIHCVYLEEIEKTDSPVLTPAMSPVASRASWAQGGIFHCRFDGSTDSFQTESDDDDDDEDAYGDKFQENDDTVSNIVIPLPLVTLTSHFDSNSFYSAKNSASDPGITSCVTLEVPEVWPPTSKQRSASVDGNFLKPDGKTESSEDGSSSSSSWLEVTQAAKSQRSKSVDIYLPLQSRRDNASQVPSTFNVLAKKKAVQGDSQYASNDIDAKITQGCCDWTENSVNGDHIWVQTSASGDFCYIGESECLKQGIRMKCAACKIIVHHGCILHLTEKIKFMCKSTFRDVGVRQYREQTITYHHWVHRRNQKGRCHQCGKSFQSKLSFGNKEIVAISCSWCKHAYHNKENCFSVQRVQEECSLGIHGNIIVPPSWIIKLPRKGSFKSSLRKSPKKRASTKRRSKKEEKERSFVVKPIPSLSSKPVIVFINPKSGGNQGAKLMQKFQWLLNPRQVFDLTHGGPNAGLEMYKKTPNIRIVACGGDGTVGWLLSALDEIGMNPPPPVAILPLGTGNDLARSIGWGGGYTDEPISKILCNIEEGDVIQLDRWDLSVESNPDVFLSTVEDGKDSLPLNVLNNYFSLGTDAYIALEFHEAREARPQKFNSRLRNKMFYGQAGGKDLLLRKFKDLCNYVTLECDGKDLTPRLKELKLHVILFLNIPSYGGGTRPWNPGSSGYENQHTDDGYIEVIGLTTYQLPLLQAGGHGYCLMQCKTARLVTYKTIPVQVDGEACRLLPSIIELKLRNQANMVAKSKIRGTVRHMPTLDKLNISVQMISMENYENLHYDKDRLKETGDSLGNLCLDLDTDLETVRKHINNMLEESNKTDKLNSEWCFLDSCTAERFFRIDRSQEQLHYVTDISLDELFVLNPQTNNSCPSIALMENKQMLSSELNQNNICMPDKNVRTEFRKCVSAESPTSESHLNDVTFRTISSPASIDHAEYTELSETSNQEIIKAVKENDLKKMKRLSDGGCNLLCVDKSGMTALHHAARQGCKDIVRYLIASAPTSIMDMIDNEKGQTALHMAAECRRRNICCMLVAAGANLSILDYENFVPKQLAERAEDQDLHAYLESQEQFQMMVREDFETAV